MAFIKSDVAKVIGAILASVAGTLLVFYPPPNTIGIVCTIAVSVLGGLGLVSGGVGAAKTTTPTT
jgi:hypothetical protein